MLFVGASCTPPKPEKTAQSIIDQAIATAGSQLLGRSEIQFDFRGKGYIAQRFDGKYAYTREWRDTQGYHRDVLTNTDLYRIVDEKLMLIPDSMKVRYSNSINSVIYFTFLPYSLNDPAVNKEYIGSAIIDGENYEKVKITFDEQGGGQDYEDVFVYWIHETRHTIDYLGYLYSTDGGGLRFRKAYNPSNVNGIRFADYINYRPEDGSIDVADLDQAYRAGKLIELSRIENTNIRVKLINAPYEEKF